MYVLAVGDPKSTINFTFQIPTVKSSDSGMNFKKEDKSDESNSKPITSASLDNLSQPVTSSHDTLPLQKPITSASLDNLSQPESLTSHKFSQPKPIAPNLQKLTPSHDMAKKNTSTPGTPTTSKHSQVEVLTPTSIRTLMDEQIIPVIRNHLKEPEENVARILKLYKRSLDTLLAYKEHVTIYDVQRRFETAIRLCVLEWYAAKFSRFQGKDKSTIMEELDHFQLVMFYVKLVNDVDKLLTSGITKYHPDFWMLGNYGVYMAVIYDELQKMVKADVKGACSHILRHYDDTNKLQKILKAAEEYEVNMARAFFALYNAMKEFVERQDEIFIEKPKKYENLSKFHSWFRPILILWLGFALHQGSEMITACVNIDSVSREDLHEKTSSSAVDTATIMHKMIIFWQKLQWPDPDEKYVVIHFLIEVICYFTVLYAKRKYEKLMLQEYYDNDGEFAISERLCTALNNIEFVKSVLDAVPGEVKYNLLIQELEESCGATQETKVYKQKVKNTIHLAQHNVDIVFGAILAGVADRMRSEVKSNVQKSLEILKSLRTTEPHDLAKSSDPILAYIHKNIMTLSESLNMMNFARMLLLFWNLVCEEVLTVGNKFDLKDSDDERKFFTRVHALTKVFYSFFDNGDGGLDEVELDSPAYRAMNFGIMLHMQSTDEIIGKYVTMRGVEHSKKTQKAPYGTLTVNVEYYDGKLLCEVLSAANLLPSEETWSCCKKQKPQNDPFVEIEIQPINFFSGSKTEKTRTVWKTVNPNFNERFSWDISQDEVTGTDGAIVFSVHDFNYMGKNDFLGDAVVSFSSIPGLTHKASPQPMTLNLRTVEMSPALYVLKSRKWDSTAQDFYQQQNLRTTIANGKQ